MNAISVVEYSSSAKHLDERQRQSLFEMRTMRKRTTFIFVVIVLVYAVLGGVIFHFIERDYGQEVQAQVLENITNFIANNNCINISDIIYARELFDRMFVGGVRIDEDDGVFSVVNSTRWDLKTSIFVAIQLLATVGYAPAAPKSVGGRVLTVVGAFLGIPLFIIMAIGIGRLFNLAADAVLRCLSVTPCCRGRFAPALATNVPWQRRFGRRRRYAYRMLGITLIGAVLLLLVPSIVFSRFEGWTYTEAVYYSVITFLTIGFGDLVPGYGVDLDWKDVGWYRLAVGCWLILETGWFAAIITSIRKLIIKGVQKAADRVAAIDEVIKPIPAKNGFVQPAIPPNNTPYYHDGLRPRFNNGGLVSTPRTHS